MALPIVLITAAVLSPIVATTALSFGLLATVSARKSRYPRAAQALPSHRSRPGNDLLPLHDELRLDSWQETVWNRIEKASWDSLNNGCGRFREQNEELLALLNEPAVDLRTVLKRLDEFKAESQKQHEAGRERWLTVYDALDVTQKERTRTFLKNRLERLVVDRQARESSTPCP